MTCAFAHDGASHSDLNTAYLHALHLITLLITQASPRFRQIPQSHPRLLSPFVCVIDKTLHADTSFVHDVSHCMQRKAARGEEAGRKDVS